MDRAKWLGGRVGTSAWHTAPSLHRRLGAMQPKNSHTGVRGASGEAVGLSVAAATRFNVPLGKVLGWGFVLQHFFKLSLLEHTDCWSPPGRQMGGRREGEGGGFQESVAWSHTPARGTCPGPGCSCAVGHSHQRTCTHTCAHAGIHAGIHMHTYTYTHAQVQAHTCAHKAHM